MEVGTSSTSISRDLGTSHEEESPRGAVGPRVGLLFAGTGGALFGVMGLTGLAMRLAQADAIEISASWFYRLMTLHGAGMLAGALMAMMGGLWFVLRRSVPLSSGRIIASYLALLLGAVAVVVAVVVGGFAAGWTFLTPLPFFPAGEWETWATVTYLVGLTGVGVGFAIFCIDVLAACTERYGGLTRTLGLRYLAGRDEDPPPPQVIAAVVVAIEGLLAIAVGTTILMALLGKAADASVALDALWAKNLTYFFGHSVANLIIYLAAGMVYVLLPRYAGRPWKTTKPIVVGWMATLLLVATAYSHHLYMDFVQPQAAQVISMTASFAAALPVAVVTIYTGLMLVWGSRYRWTLASTLLYLGFAGWAIGGAGAVLDSLIPLNFRLHNTLWVPAHFHTYLMGGVILWLMALLVHLLEKAAGRAASRFARFVVPSAIALGAYGLVAAWYVSGAAGVPRRYAEHASGAEGYSIVASIFVMVLALGVLALLLEMALLGRDALRRRAAGSPARGDDAEEREPVRGERRPPLPVLGSGLQLSIVVAGIVVAASAFLPSIVEAAEANDRYHHLLHGAEFAFGLLLGTAVASSRPLLFRRGLSSAGSAVALATVILAPAVMLLAMVPAIYDELAASGGLHQLYHLAIAGLGFATGIAASALGRVPGRLLLVLAIGMAAMYAAGVTGG